MATTSPNLPTISLHFVPTKPSIRNPLQSLVPSLPSSPKVGLSLEYSEDTITVGAAVEAITLANAAAEAARDALVLLHKESEFRSEKDEISQSCVEAMKRRKKRRKRRKAGDLNEESKIDDIEMKFSFKKSSSVCLTRKQEAECTLYLKEEAKLEEGGRWDKLTGNKRKNIERIVFKARESRERIIVSYRRLVVSIATKYQGKGLSLKELIQEGNIGLLRGAERFDPEKGFKLSTYVYWWIKQAIARAIETKSRIIRLPGSMCEMIPKIAEANNMLSTKLRRRPTYYEIAEVIDIQVSSIMLVCKRSRPPISLNKTLTDMGHMTMQEVIPGPEELQPEILVKKQAMKKELHGFLMKLGKREEIVLRLYFGLNGDTPRSCEEIGRILNLSRERVRQIHGIALTKLKQNNNMDSILSVYMP
ncbi:hypothetical protein ACHQM5_012460 [Ranunculus cassubicifolius]